MKKILTKKEIIDAKEKVIIENFHKVSNQLGMLTETIDETMTLESYYNNVLSNLEQLDAGDKLINHVKTAERLKQFIKTNFKNGFDALKTAQALRDYWYGV